MRIFVAIAIPPEVAERLSSMQSGLENARWVSRDNMHITLRFVGEVANHRIDDLDAVLSDVVAPAFDLSLSGVGHFGSGHMARQVWAGVEPSLPLDHLHGKIESAAVRAGFAPEGRKFKPHVTLGRLKSSRRARPGDSLRRYLQGTAGFAAGPFAVDHFILMQSSLGHGGAHYRSIATYPLQPPD